MCPRAFVELCTLFQSLVLSAKQSKHQLQVGEEIRTPTVQNYLLPVMNILASAMFREVLRVRGGARAHSYRMRVYFTQKSYRVTYSGRGDAEYPRQSKYLPPKRITRDIHLLVGQYDVRAQVPIFDTTQMGYLSIVGTWTLSPFSGAL